jgi:hypothetical protein
MTWKWALLPCAFTCAKLEQLTVRITTRIWEIVPSKSYRVMVCRSRGMDLLPSSNFRVLVAVRVDRDSMYSHVILSKIRTNGNTAHHVDHEVTIPQSCMTESPPCL